MAVAHVTAHLQVSGLRLLLVVVPGHVGSVHVARGNALAAASPPSATATAGEAAVVHVVATADEGELHVVGVSADVSLGRVSVLGAVAHVGVDEPPLLHALLDGQVQYGLLLAVVDAGDAAVVALLFVRLQFFHHLCRDVLHGHLCVVGKEFLAVHHDFRHRLAVDLDGSVVAHLGTGQFLHQFLQVRALGHAEGTGVEDKRVLLHLHLSQLGRHGSLLHHLGILLQGDGAQVEGLLLSGEGYILILSHVSHVRDAQQILSELREWHVHAAVHVAHDAGHLCAVLRIEQYDGSSRQGLVQSAVHDGAGHCGPLALLCCGLCGASCGGHRYCCHLGFSSRICHHEAE